MIANILIEKFHEGGPIMYPIVAVMIVALAVVLERCVWWFIHSTRREPAKLEKVYTALEQGSIDEASAVAKNAKDPVVKILWHALNHHHASLEGALSVASGIELQKAGRFLVAMDTLITLAPLLGLLGTVTGIMNAFQFVGNEELAVTKVSGGIGEALIATACGLAIAIFTLVPYNWFGAKVAQLQFEIETAANNLEVMLKSIKKGEPVA
ncbi:MAG TPA: MotA/TolQ/ExbB proton channel family protein [Chthoniobacterales bacterium]